MNYGPLIFLAAFFTLAASWFGLVLSPALRVGHLQQTNVLQSAISYPLARPGFGREGADIYRANGCASCPSQQIHQTGTVFDLYLATPGTNQPEVTAAIQKLRPDLSELAVKDLLARLPARILAGKTPEE